MYKYGYIDIDGTITSKIILLVGDDASLYGAFESSNEYEVGYKYDQSLNTYIAAAETLKVNDSSVYEQLDDIIKEILK
jgi:hypothetical protein